MSDRTKNLLVVLFMVVSALAATSPVQRAEFLVKVGTRTTRFGQRITRYGFAVAEANAL